MKFAKLLLLTILVLPACTREKEVNIIVENKTASPAPATLVVEAPRPPATPIIQSTPPPAAPNAPVVTTEGPTKVLLVESAPTVDRSKLGSNTLLPEKYDAPEKALKTFFSALHDKNYDVTWESLSLESQRYFIDFYSKRSGVSAAQAKERFDKTLPEVRKNFWDPFNLASEEAKLVGNATFSVADVKNNVALVEMTSGGISYHYKAVKEGDFWKLGYVETYPQGLSKAFK